MKPVADLPKISAPALRAMQHAGIRTLNDLQNRTEKDLLKLHGMGPKTLRILKENMQQKGLLFMKS